MGHYSILYTLYSMKNSNKLFEKHNKYMYQALRQAQSAYDDDEVPVGAIIVHEGNIMAKAYNQVERLNDPTAHAEILAITSACATLGRKYLQDCTLYVTLEPCPMCAGALVWSKLSRLVFGAADTESGACGTVFNLAEQKKLNHQIEVIQGIREIECEELLKKFFRNKRSRPFPLNGNN